MQIRRLLALTLIFTAGMVAYVAAQTPTVAPSVMAVLFLEAQRAGTVEAWTAFLEVCGGSPYCDLAEAARTALLPKPENAPAVAEPNSEPAPVSEAAEMPAASTPEPPVAFETPDEVVTPAEPPVAAAGLKPQPAKRIATPKPKPKPRPQARPRRPDPEHTGSIPRPAALPGTQPRPTGLIKESAPETSVAPKSGTKPKAAGMRSSADKRGFPPGKPD